MARNPGIIYRLEDGRLAVWQESEQKKFNGMSKRVLLLYDSDYKPIISPKTLKQATIFRTVDELEKLKITGYVD